MDQINTLLSNRYEAILNKLLRKDQYPLDMVVLELKASRFDEFDLAFQQEARRLVEINTIPLYYVLRVNEVGNYDPYWSRREERLKNCFIFTGETYIKDSK